MVLSITSSGPWQLGHLQRLVHGVFLFLGFLHVSGRSVLEGSSKASVTSICFKVIFSRQHGVLAGYRHNPHQKLSPPAQATNMFPKGSPVPKLKLQPPRPPKRSKNNPEIQPHRKLNPQVRQVAKVFPERFRKAPTKETPASQAATTVLKRLPKMRPPQKLSTHQAQVAQISKKRLQTTPTLNTFLETIYLYSVEICVEWSHRRIQARPFATV